MQFVWFFLDFYTSMPFYKIIKIVIHLSFSTHFTVSLQFFRFKTCKSFFLIYCLQQNVIYKHVSALLFQMLLSISVLQEIRNIKKKTFKLL